jgi:hypothetical protein
MGYSKRGYIGVTTVTGGAVVPKHAQSVDQDYGPIISKDFTRQITRPVAAITNSLMLRS